MNPTPYDIAIIGSGPGGYVAGLYASRCKLKTCVIEKGLIGGTCLNKGCIPTKTILNSAAILQTVKDAPMHGIDVKGYSVDFPKIMSRKEEVVVKLRTGIETLFRANSVDLVRGRASLSDANTIKTDDRIINAKSIIIAAGSRASELAGIPIDEKDILSSDGVLDLKELPKSIAIIGGGVIGCEFAGLFSAFGVKVTIIEYLDRIICGQSREASKKLELIFKKRGIDIFTSAKAEAITRKTLLSIAVSGNRTVEAEKVLVAAGRAPATGGLGLEKLGIKTQNSKICVDSRLRTSIKNIYAIGDCVAGPLLAHKASYDGILACDNIMGKTREVDYSNVPSCIWTEPEIASVGLSEEEAKAKHQDVKIAKFPYLASGKAFLMGKSEGFIKIIGSSKTGSIFGVEIFGAGACDLIGEAALAKTMGINIKEWAGVVHGHPTLSEIIQEAAHIFCGTGIHSPAAGSAFGGIPPSTKCDRRDI